MKDTCTIEACSKPVLARGWCNSHYLRWRRTGDPLGSTMPSPICTVDGCEKPVHGNGLCDAHYSRQRRHGSPTAGGIVRGSVQAFLAELVDHSGDECVRWPFAVIKVTGHGELRHKGRTRTAHTLVCEMVNGPKPSPKHQAAHSCGMGHKACVNPRHLSWKTPSENAADKLIHGTHNRGEQNPHAVLTEHQVREVRALKGKIKQTELASRLGVTRSAIACIQQNRAWAWLR